MSEESESLIGMDQAPADNIEHTETDAVDTTVDNITEKESEIVSDYENAVEDDPSTSYTVNDLESNPDINGETKEAHDDDTNDQSKKSNRELKLLLALSKEANLNTNISHKRKTTENTKYKDSYILKTSPDSAEKIKKTPKPHVENRVIRYPVTAETELEESIMQPEENDKNEKDTSFKIVKRKKESAAEAVTGGATEEISKKSRKSFSSEIVMFKPNKDMFCWRCHRDGVNIACETCPRAYHQKCLKQTITDPDHWPCPECVSILKAESTQTRSEAMKGMDLEHLCSLLKHAVKRMIQCGGSEPFIHAVNESDFPDYKKYIIQPMDLTSLERNIKQNLYGSTQAFEADAKWILHNSIIFNSYQSKLTSAAKSIVKICKQEMAEIENCPSCYQNANTKKDTWFVEVCPKPHVLLWAKLKGFPYWPAKFMCANSTGMVDVRFFGAHDKAWVSNKDCYIYSLKDPNSYKQKRYDIDQCIKELNIYVKHLKSVFGEVRLAPFKTLLEPENEMKHLQYLLPKYNPNTNYKFIIKKIYEESLEGNASGADASDADATKDEDHANESLRKSPDIDSTMEGYGTDDENKSEIGKKLRKMLTGETFESDELEECEKMEDEDDTQVANSKSPSLAVIRGKVRTRGGFSNSTGKLKVIPRRLSETLSKRASTDAADSPNKIPRRNSEQNVKISDKISTLNIEENVEISLSNDESGRLSVSEKSSSVCSSSSSNSDVDSTNEIRVKPVQVNIDNMEVSISPKSKLKITDTLIRRLTDADEVPAAEVTEETDLVVEKQAESVEETNDGDNREGVIASAEDAKENDVKESCPAKVEAEKMEVDGVEKSKSENEDLSSKTEEETKGILEKEADSSEVKEPPKISSELQSIIEEFDEEGDSSLDDSQINVADLSSIIHSSLKPTAAAAEVATARDKVVETDAKEKTVEPPTVEVSVTRKRKISESNEDEGVLNHHSKMVKIVSIEKILNPPANPADKENAVQSVKESRPSKKEDALGAVIKSEPESSEESDSEYMEKKRTYLSALNISEKHNEPVKNSLKANEIRTRSKTEEKANKFKIVDNMSKVIDDVALHYSAVHEGEQLPPKKPDKRKIAVHKEDVGEIQVKSFAKLTTNSKQRARKSFPTPNYAKFSSPARDSVLRKPPPADTNKKKETETKTTAPVSDKSVSSTSVFKTTATLQSISTSVSHQTATPPSKPVVFVQSNSAAPQGVPPLARPTVTLVSSSPVVTAQSNSPAPKPPQAATVQHKPPVTLDTVRTAGLVFIAPTSQDVVLLPQNQTITYTSTSNPILSLLPPPLTASSTISSTKPSQPTEKPPQNETTQGTHVSQNYIPQNETAGEEAPAANTLLNSLLAKKSSTDNSRSELIGSDQPAEVNEQPPSQTRNAPTTDLNLLNGFLPETVTRAVSDLLCRPPPRLKPRPPGALSCVFEEGNPSSAGIVTSKINSIAHRLSDYFRGMLIETLDNFGQSDNPEATITGLKLEIESLKHKHEVDLSEIKKNVSTILEDIQRSIVEERERAIAETRASCEAEAVKRVEDAKSKQWCANCSEEAQFYCCWNTSYCDYPCQQKHWSKHMNKCTQNYNQTAAAPLRPQSQQIVLRPTNPPPNKQAAIGRIITSKPTKVYMNRVGGTPKAMSTFKRNGNHLTLVEATPGNYELIGSNGVPLSMAGKIITTPSLLTKIKSGSVSLTTTTANSGSPGPKSTAASPQAKTPNSSVSNERLNLISDDESE